MASLPDGTEVQASRVASDDTATEVDELKRRETAMHRNEVFLDRTGKLAGVGGWEVDLLKQELHWSDETYRIHGLPVGQTPTLSQAIEFYAPEARPVIAAAVKLCSTLGEPWDLELPFVRADGRAIWVRSVGSADFVDGKPVRLVGAFQDITAQVQEHQKLKEANERVALATETSGIGIWEYDTSARVFQWDPGMYRLHGLPPSDGPLTAETGEQLIPAETLSTLRDSIGRALRDLGSFEMEYTVVWPDGSQHYLHTSGRAKVDSEGRSNRVVGANWDVTDQRQLAIALRQQSLLASVQATVATAANEATQLSEALRTCINLVCSHADWALGHAYVRSPDHPGRLMPSNIWNRDADPIHVPFRQETARTSFTPGLGIVGAVMQDGTAIVFDDLASRSFLRSKSAMQSGLQRGLAAPVMVGDEVHAVLEFYTTEPRPIGQSQIDLITYVGVQLGRVIDRERAQSTLRTQASALRQQSMVDELTGLYNRRGFLELSEARLKEAERQSQRAFLVFVDLDGMKRINDELGHDAGDAALVETAHILKASLRDLDVIARLGGDEFAALTLETGTFNAEAMVGRVREAVADFNASDRHPFRLEVSIGVSGPAEADESVLSLLKRADALMYENKIQRGRGRTETYRSPDGPRS